MKSRILVSVSLAGLVMAGSARAADKFEKPADAFDAFVKAMKKNDLKAAHATLTPGSGDKFALRFVFLTLVSKKLALAFDKSGKVAEAFEPVDKALQKHGLKEDKLEEQLKEMRDEKDEEKIAAGIKKILSPVKDQGAMLADLGAALEKVSKDNKKDAAEAKLSDVQIDGGKATGTIKTKQGDQEKSVKVKFEKLGGSWKMELPKEFFEQKGKMN